MHHTPRSCLFSDEKQKKMRLYDLCALSEAGGELVFIS
jgi:hypothetical protein